jgi:glycosyltransferase involved in cell wall biosynthesis
VLVCNSDATRARLCSYLPSVAERTTVIPLAVSNAFRDTEASPVDRLTDRPFALVVGDPSPRKNLGFVIDLWPHVLERDPEATLVVVGPPSWGPTEHGQAFDSLLGSGRLVSLDHATDATLRWCYEHARVVLCPSVLEGYGLPAAEALALGAPVITSEDPALCEVSGAHAEHLAADDPAGWLEAIVAALASPRPLMTPPVTPSWAEITDLTVAAARRGD